MCSFLYGHPFLHKVYCSSWPPIVCGNPCCSAFHCQYILPLLLQYFCCSALPHVPAKLPALKRRRPLLLKRLLLQTPRKAAVQKNRSSSMSGRKTLKPHCRSMKRSMSTRTTSIRSNTRLNLKRMVNAIFRYLQIYCFAGTTVGFSRIFAFVNKSKS